MKLFKRVNKGVFKKFIIFLIIFSIGAASGYAYFTKKQGPTSSQAFLSEVYDKIKENYWENITDTQLLDLFKLSIEKNTDQIQTNKFKDKDELLKSTQNINQKDLINVISSVLTSLQPAGRSGLFTQKQEIALKNTVENRNPETGKVEPTIFTKVAGQGVGSPPKGILYLQFKKFSPTSLDEFQKAFESYKDNSSLYGLVLDLRGNIGGAIDATAYFMGYFLGKNQYAFDFYKKGEYLPFKTPTDKLPSISKYKQVVVLVDNNTQSSAEMMAASMKKYHIGVVLGVPTKGWGTVERVFPLDNQISKEEKYSMFLVHSITLRDDNLPIEGRGVEPDINIKDVNWNSQLMQYFSNPVLMQAVKSVLLSN